jgi:putative flippase GtrA
MANNLQSLLVRFERPLRYLAAGIGVTAFYSAQVAFFVMSGLISDPTTATIIASLITAPVSFLIHARITYPDVPQNSAHLFRFLFITFASFLIVTISMRLVDKSGLPFWVGLVVGWVLVPIANYLINTFWVFRPKTFLRVGQGQRDSEYKKENS